MPRLFVAIDFPDPIKNQLATMLSGVPGAKWVQRHQLHVTLRFIGEVEDARFQEIRRVLAEIQAESFSLTLKGVGQFPPKGSPRVLWVGMDEPPALKSLYQQIEARLTQIGIAPEDRPFSAHLTLARLKTPPPRDTVDRFLEHHARFASEPIPITQFVLFSSVLASQGPTYTAERIYPLSG